VTAAVPSIGAANREAKKLLASLGLDIDPTTRMGSLPVGLQQLVELSRVLFSGARIIILDEPTSALSPPEVARLFGVLRKLRAEGHSLIFISHFLDDVIAISDRITVFRNGRGATEKVAISMAQGIGYMIGHRRAAWARAELRAMIQANRAHG
jgi:ribose transport system ATP-binding protein